MTIEAKVLLNVIGVIFGLAVFYTGIFCALFIVRTSSNDWFELVHAEKYRARVRASQSPLWPLRMMYTCIPAGIAIVFASFLLHR